MNARATTLTAALACLERAVRPLVLVGPEGAPAVSELLRVAELLGARVLTTPDALSLVAAERSSGVFSFGASARARRAAEEADVVLAASALGEFSTRLGRAFRDKRVIQVVESVTDARYAPAPEVLLTGPVRRNLTGLLHALEAWPRPRKAACTPLERARDSVEPLTAAPGTLHPRAALAALAESMPASSRLCLDVTSGALQAYEHWAPRAGDRVFSSIERSACMGEALLASIGIRLASGAPTLALVGDWGFCMAPHELHTAVELGLSRYVVVVWSNSGGAFIGAGVAQQGIRIPEDVWRWRTAVDFARLAEGLGARGAVVTTASDLSREVRAGLAANGPVLIDARIDPNAAVPAGDRFLSLGVEHS